MPQHPRLLRVCRRILANPTQQLTLDDCARMCDMGRRTFTRTFRREMQTPFTTWRALFGHYTVEEGVARLLQDSGLEFVIDGQGSVALRRARRFLLPELTSTQVDAHRARPAVGKRKQYDDEGLAILDRRDR